MKTVSVVIPTYNSRSEKNNGIEIVLRSLLGQTHDAFEIVIVDNATTDDTLTQLSAVREALSNRGVAVRVVSCRSRGNKSLARNVGAEAAANQILVFLDDDTVLMTNRVLESVCDKLGRGQFACGARRYWTILHWDGQRALDEARDNRFDYLKSVSHLPRGIKRGSGMRDLNEFTWIACFGALWKDDFTQIGGFDTNYSGWGRHDMDLMLRLLDRGLRFVNLFEDVSVTHLNHRVIEQDLQRKRENILYYLAKEDRLGRSFKPNHLFGVYEGDGTDVLMDKKISRYD